jgi:hypothetical protein
VLKNGGKHNHGLTARVIEQQGAVAHAVLGLAAQDRGDRVFAGMAFDQSDVQTRLAVIAFFKGGIISGELELVLPAQLQGDRFECRGGAALRYGPAQGKEERSQQQGGTPCLG